MKKIIRLLLVLLNAVIEAAEEKPNSSRLSIYGAREKLEAGTISIREYNELFEHQDQ